MESNLRYLVAKNNDGIIQVIIDGRNAANEQESVNACKAALSLKSEDEKKGCFLLQILPL